MSLKALVFKIRAYKCDLFAHVLIAPIIDNTTITIYSLSDGFYAKKRYYNIPHMCYYIKYYNKYTQSSINDSLNDAFIIIAWRGGSSPNKSLLATLKLRVRFMSELSFEESSILSQKMNEFAFLWVFKSLVNSGFFVWLDECDNYKAMIIIFQRTLQTTNSLNLRIFEREKGISFVIPERKLLHPKKREKKNRLNYHSCHSLNPFQLIFINSIPSSVFVVVVGLEAYNFISFS